ncbi:MAG: RNA 3'-terminal phosphate cyclase [Halodesulfurarchaeum sp.]
MLTLDGGDGGGQLIRWAVALSAVTGTPIRMRNVRGARDTPGLRPQHVAAIGLLEEITDARTEGVDRGSTEVLFEPKSVRGGEYAIDIGTAGSVSLVVDTVLPLGVTIPDRIAVDVSGGTDVKWAPPIDYTRHVKRPLLSRSGLELTLSVDRRGFYPAGGGQVHLNLDPSSLESIDRDRRGALVEVSVYSVASESLSDASVAERQADAARDAVSETVSVPVRSTVEYAETASKGSSILIVTSFDRSVAGFSALGEPGKPSEDVAADAVERTRDFLDTEAAVDAHMADQLLPFLAVAGGSFTCPDDTDHLRTAIDIVEAFGVDLKIEDEGDLVRIAVESPLSVEALKTD